MLCRTIRRFRRKLKRRLVDWLAPEIRDLAVEAACNYAVSAARFEVKVQMEIRRLELTQTGDEHAD